MNTTLQVLNLLAAPVSAIVGFFLGCLTGAYIHYRGRIGKNPVPLSEVVEAVRRKREPEEPAKPQGAPRPLMKP